MKKLFTIILISLSLSVAAQTTIQPDTICINAIGEIQFVTNTPTSTYQWSVLGGGGSISVIESNANGCPGAPVTLDVYLLDLGINAIGPFCVGDPTTSLIGIPNTGTFSGTGVIANAFQPSSAGVGVHVITYSLAGCNTTINVTVNNGPVTGPIQHY